jgi:hypothetical protein
MWSVCTVTYGDYPDLISKTLKSLHEQYNSRVQDIRIGLNDVSEATFDAVMRWCSTFRLCPVYVYQEVNNKNVGKYALMRRMFYEHPSPLTDSEAVMWFDDDSYLGPGVGDSWWDTVESALARSTVVGLTHYISSRGNQYLGIKDQPWYTDAVVNKRHRFAFATGAWWVAKAPFLYRWDYPFKEIYHNGGDSILGELCRQQSAVVYDFKHFAQCNAKCCLKGAARDDGVVQVNVGGREGRRGIGKKTADEVYPWHFYGEREQSYEHHNFDVRIYKFDGLHS